MSLTQLLNRLTDSALSDTAERRRSRLLNILLIGVAAISIVALVGLLLFSIVVPIPGMSILLIGTLVMMVGIGVCYWLNRRGNVILASAFFLTLITLVFAYADTPTEVVKGRTLFMFVIPILMASFLLRPFASFVVAAAVSVMHIIIAFTAPVPDYTPIGLTAFAVIALVAWLAASNLENALVNLQHINEELDQRVTERTRELAASNYQLQQQSVELVNFNLRLEQQARDLASANQQLKELDRLKSKFVSDVSHELRTPISNLVIYLEMMGVMDRKNDERYLKVLRDETSRLEKLVTDILNISRLETGTVKVNFAWVTLNEIVEQVTLANQVRANAKNLDVVFTPGNHIPTIWAVSDQLKQVLNNLLGNAINYTLEGNIQIATWFDAAQNRVGLKVSDTGPGIAPEDIPHLFERFYRGQQAGQSTIPGTGLGLSITKEVIALHQGTIEVESEPGKGSTFTVMLPVEPAPVAPSGEGSNEQSIA